MHCHREQASLSEAEFFAWAEPRDGRYELVDGAVRMQVGASRDHERVAKAVFAALHAQVDLDAFDVNKGDFGVPIAEGSRRGSVLYPDVVVDRQCGDGDERVTSTALVVIEVLSPSTDLAHHLRKFERYKRVESLTTYLVFDPRTPVARLWRRDGGGWQASPTIVSEPAACIDMPDIGAIIRLADVYRKPWGLKP